MFGSIFVGLSGMNAYSAGLRLLSNNITNVNTTGFKSSTLGFADLFGQGGSTGDAGHGVSLRSPHIDFSQGELRQSDRDLDIAIDGTGMLVLEKNGERYLTRTGSFEVNQDGAVVLAGTTYQLTVLDANGNPSPASVAADRINPPQKTSKVTFASNLSSTATTYSLPDLTVYDAAGKSDTWRAKFTRNTAVAGEWSVAVTNSSGIEIGRQLLKFTSGVIDPTTSKLTFEDAAQGRSVEFDFSVGVTSFSSGEVSTLTASKVDGYGLGEINALRVNDKGALEVAYTNTQTKSLGQITVANVHDLQKLEQRDAGLFVLGAGQAVDYLPSGVGGQGRAQSKRVEASNVDLSREFGELILVQRGYQASSQVVSVSNEMIQQLFGIRGQS